MVACGCPRCAYICDVLAAGYILAFDYAVAGVVGIKCGKPASVVYYNGEASFSVPPRKYYNATICRNYICSFRGGDACPCVEFCAACNWVDAVSKA